MAEYDPGNEGYDPGTDSPPVNDVAPVDTGMYYPPSPEEQRSADVSQYYSDYGSPAPTDYQPDTPPSGAQLGITAQQASGLISPPEEQMPASPGVFAVPGVKDAFDAVGGAVGGALSAGRNIATGELGNLVAAYFPGSPQDTAYKDAINRIVNDPRNADADWTDWRIMAQAQMQAGRESWDQVPDVPLLKGAVEAAVDPTNLLFAGVGPAVGALKGGVEAAGGIRGVLAGAEAGAGRFAAEDAGMGQIRKILPGSEKAVETIGSLGSKIKSAAEEARLKSISEDVQAVTRGDSTVEQLTNVRKAQEEARAAEAAGDTQKAAKIREALGEGPAESGAQAGAQSPLEAKLNAEGPLGQRLREGAATAEERATEAAGGTSAATERLNAGLGKDIAEDAETKAAMAERDTAIKDSGIKYEDLPPEGQARLDAMYGVTKTGDPEMNWVGKTLAPLAEVSNAMRTLLTSWDLSMGRQASGLLGGAPASVGKGLRAQIDALKMTDSEFRDETAKIVARVMAKGGRKLAIGGPGSFEEEAKLGSKLVEKLPGIKGSEQAYTHGLNVARSDAFLTGVESMEQAAGRKLTQDELDQFASHINHLTGRGDVPKGTEEAFKMINGVFFAPRYRLSRAQVATDFANSALGVMKDVATAMKNGEPIVLNPVDKKILSMTSKYFGSIESVARAGQFSEHLLGRENTYSDVGAPGPFGGQEDPTATKFGKLDVGAPGSPGAIAAGAGELFGLGTQSYQGKGERSETVKVDPWAGFGPEIRTAFREFRNLQGAIAAMRGQEGPAGAKTLGSDFGSYLREGESPLVSIGQTAIPTADHPGQKPVEHNPIGQKVGPTDWTSGDFQRNPLLSSAIPLAWQGIAQDTGLPYPGKEGPMFGPSTAQPGEGLNSGREIKY